MSYHPGVRIEVESLSEVSKLCGRYYSNSNLNEFSFFAKKKLFWHHMVWLKVGWSNVLAESQLLPSLHLTLLTPPQLAIILLVLTTDFFITCWLNDFQSIAFWPDDVLSFSKVRKKLEHLLSLLEWCKIHSLCSIM